MSMEIITGKFNTGGHPIDPVLIHRSLYRLLAYVFAYPEVASYAESLAPIAGRADEEISHTLISIAAYLRVHNDALAQRPSTGFCGELIRGTEDNFENLTLREACNKLIHATGLGYTFDSLAERGRARRPLITASGTKDGEEWVAHIDVVQFAHAALAAVG